MKIKYTPGPWKIEIGKKDMGGEREIGIFSEAEKTSYGSFKYVVLPNSQLKKSDARLIAAAPELLEACKAALVCIADMPEFWAEEKILEEKILREIISKAEGEKNGK